MDDTWLAERFEANRGHLRAVAYRMLGSRAEADDAVQEGWLRLSKAGADGVENLSAWLTTVVGRICLNMLRARATRREESLDVRPAQPAASGPGSDPEQEAIVADAVGPALLVVLDSLTPAERLAFVLHDMFDVPFDQVAAIVDRSPDAARQLASRARRRVHAAPAATGADARLQREAAEAFLAASRDGDFSALLAVLDPQIVLRADAAASPDGTPTMVRGGRAVASGARMFSAQARHSQVALINGVPGIVLARDGRLARALIVQARDGVIVALEIIAEAERLDQLTVTLLA
jgi:RNA polymerase sigma factor (sigma-70 family)